MIPRPKSIFTLGEEGEPDRRGEQPAASLHPPRPAPRKPTPAPDLVGLRILIQRTEPADSNVVAKSTLRSSTRRPAASPPSPEAGWFLKECFLCGKELSPQKDVYMYRGDLGFCSEECRCRQILVDDRRGMEAATRERLPSPARLRAGHRLRESDRRRRILAVA